MWLQWIENQLLKLFLGNSFEPETKLKPGDHIVGVIRDPDLRDLYRLLICYDESMTELSAKTAHDFKKLSEAARDERAQEHQLLSVSYDVVCGLFWVTLCEQFPVLINKPELTICKGWRIVWGGLDDEGIEFPSDLLSGTPSKTSKPIRLKELGKDGFQGNTAYDSTMRH